MIEVHVGRSGLNIYVFAAEVGKRIVEPLISGLADRAEQIMIEKAPVRTGALRASIQKKIMEKEAEIGPTVPYAVYVEFGTRPHEIRPVYARALRFEVAGRVVFAARVQHPGTRPQPFIRETAEQVVSELPSIYEQIFREAVGE